MSPTTEPLVKQWDKLLKSATPEELVAAMAEVVALKDKWPDPGKYHLLLNALAMRLVVRLSRER